MIKVYWKEWDIATFKLWCLQSVFSLGTLLHSQAPIYIFNVDTTCTNTCCFFLWTVAQRGLFPWLYIHVPAVCVKWWADSPTKLAKNGSSWMLWESIWDSLQKKKKKQTWKALLFNYRVYASDDLSGKFLFFATYTYMYTWNNNVLTTYIHMQSCAHENMQKKLWTRKVKKMLAAAFLRPIFYWGVPKHREQAWNDWEIMSLIC